MDFGRSCPILYLGLRLIWLQTCPNAPVIFNRTVGDGLTQLFGVVLAPSAKPNALLAALDSLVL